MILTTSKRVVNDWILQNSSTKVNFELVLRPNFTNCLGIFDFSAVNCPGSQNQLFRKWLHPTTKFYQRIVDVVYLSPALLIFFDSSGNKLCTRCRCNLSPVINAA